MAVALRPPVECMDRRGQRARQRSPAAAAAHPALWCGKKIWPRASATSSSPTYDVLSRQGMGGRGLAAGARPPARKHEPERVVPCVEGGLVPDHGSGRAFTHVLLYMVQTWGGGNEDSHPATVRTSPSQREGPRAQTARPRRQPYGMWASARRTSPLPGTRWQTRRTELQRARPRQSHLRCSRAAAHAHLAYTHGPSAACAKKVTGMPYDGRAMGWTRAGGGGGGRHSRGSVDSLYYVHGL